MQLHIFVLLSGFFLCEGSVLSVGVDLCDDYADTKALARDKDLAAEIETLKKEPFIAISLGENCAPTEHLRQHNIRIRSFPFDWNITSVQSLCALLENDFEGMLDRKNLVIQGDMVRNTRYNFILAHDFTVLNFYNGPDGLTPKNEAGKEQYKKVLEYYQRRIARLYAVFKIPAPLYLFRRVITSDEAKKLHKLLKIKFPASNFTLVCVEDGPLWESVKKWNIPGIVHFKMQQHEAPTHTPGKGNAAWTHVLKQLCLIKV